MQHMSEPTGLQIKLAAMSLIWQHPSGDQFIPWLKEVKSADYEGISGFAEGSLKEHLEDPASFGKLLNNEGLQLASVDVKVSEDLNFDQYHRLCSSMERLDCRHLVCIDNPGMEKNFGFHAERLNKIGEISRSYKIETYYHNHTGGVGETFGDMENLLREINRDKVSIMVDLGHATKDFTDLTIEKRAVTFLEKYIDQIGFLEFKDWTEETELNTPVGEGYTDYLKVFEILKSNSYSGWITVEQNGNRNKLSRGRTPLECAKQSREFIRQGLGV